jgi:hypothetical protein
MFDKMYRIKEYECMNERKIISESNKYYFDLYYMVVYYTFMEEMNEYLNMCIILLNIGFNEFKKSRYISAYGIIKKMILFAKEKKFLVKLNIR